MTMNEIYVGAEDLSIDNPFAPAAVCCLWTPRDRLTIPHSYVNVVGNLYSPAGMNLLLRNLLANPYIRYLYVVGADKSGTGDVLVNFFEEGWYAQDGVRYFYNTRVPIDPALKTEDLMNLRRLVEIIDVRSDDMKKPKDISSYLTNAIPTLPARPPRGEPVFVELTPPKIVEPKVGSEISGFRIYADNFLDAHVDLVDLILKVGHTREGFGWGHETREIMNPVVVFNAETFPHMPEAEKKAMDAYALQVTTPDEAEGVEYTYGQRLRFYKTEEHDNCLGPDGICYGEEDQIHRLAWMIDNDGDTRRAYATTWRVGEDMNSENPPCLVGVHVLLQGDRLHMTATFRSQDAMKAFPKNAYALTSLLHVIAGEVGGYRIGTVTMIAHSSHIYEGDYAQARELVKKNRVETVGWREDPRGYFVIEVAGLGLVARHATKEEGFTGYEFRGVTAKRVGELIAASQLVSLPEHYIYLGRELQKAEEAMNRGTRYEQDK